MKKLRQFIWAAVIIGSVLTPSATAAESFSVLLQKGIFAEETEGNLDAAIKIYQQITAEAATDRSVVAQAQYRLGVCYQKKGNKEQAINILNDLLKQFPAEAALGQKARESATEATLVEKEAGGIMSPQMSTTQKHDAKAILPEPHSVINQIPIS